MAQKRSRISQASTSFVPPTQYDPYFPNYRLSSEAHTEIYLKVKYFKMVSEKEFDVEYFEGCEELIIMLEEKG